MLLPMGEKIITVPFVKFIDHDNIFSMSLTIWGGGWKQIANTKQTIKCTITKETSA